MTAMIGCGKPSNGRLAVSGIVNFDKVPLDNGVITFISGAKKMPSGAAAIRNGKYELPSERGLVPGTYQVAIDAADASQTGVLPDHPAMSIPLSRIPQRYNGKTELTAEVAVNGNNYFCIRPAIKANVCESQLTSCAV